MTTNHVHTNDTINVHLLIQEASKVLDPLALGKYVLLIIS